MFLVWHGLVNTLVTRLLGKDCCCLTNGSYYFPVVMGIAGIKSQHMQLLLNAINPVMSLITSVAGASLIDRLGRRPMLLTTIIFGSVCFAILTGTSKAAVADNNARAGNVTIACKLSQ